MSMPAATPDDVHQSRSSTQRASAIHSTATPCWRAQAKDRSFEVARLPVEQPRCGEHARAGADRPNGLGSAGPAL
jgi:hypothetical protein